MDLHQEIINLKRDNDKAWLLVKKLEEENAALQDGLRNASKELDRKSVNEIKRATKNYFKKLKKERKKNQKLKKFIVKNCDLTIQALNVLIKNDFDNKQS